MIGWMFAAAMAGLGPTGTLVVFDASEPDAAELAAYYAQQRELPSGHTCGIVDVPDDDTIDLEAFGALRDQLEACLASLPQPDEIDVLVTVRGLPYLVSLDQGQVGFEAALAVGGATGPDGEAVAGRDQEAFDANLFRASVPNPSYVGGGCRDEDLTLERNAAVAYRTACTLTREKRLPTAFRRDARWRVGGFDFSRELFVVARLDGFDFEDARALVDRGVAADGALPSGAFLCMEGADPARGARDPECEFVVRKLGEIGANAEWVAPFDPTLADREVVAYLTGAADLRGAIQGLDYAPGAFVDNLTSFGAVPSNFRCDESGAMCPAAERQTSVARFVRAGATAVHGTVAEPLNNSFPDAGALLLYQEGYSLGESVLFAQEYLYWFNLLVGDPLTTPFATRPEVTLGDLVEGEPLVVTAAHPDGIRQLRLYAEDVLVAEAEGDVLQWVHGLGAGEEARLRAVATSAPVLVGRPPADRTVTPPAGWDQPDDEGQLVRPDTEGWQVVTREVAAPSAGAGCGCATPGSGTPGWGLLLGLLLRHRRSAS